MSQNREPPAYQEYAATILANLHFRRMTLQERGLLYTMRNECWVNMRLPQNHNELAKVLGLPVTEIADSLEAVMPFFEVVNGFIICPDLEEYRGYLADRRGRQSAGGKTGSAITNRNRNRNRNRPVKAVDDGVSSTLSSTSRVPRRDSVESLVQSSTEKPSQNQSSKTAIATNQFVAEYEATESCTAKDYAQASGGG